MHTCTHTPFKHFTCSEWTWAHFGYPTLRFPWRRFSVCPLSSHSPSFILKYKNVQQIFLEYLSHARHWKRCIMNVLWAHSPCHIQGKDGYLTIPLFLSHVSYVCGHVCFIISALTLCVPWTHLSTLHQNTIQIQPQNGYFKQIFIGRQKRSYITVIEK